MSALHAFIPSTLLASEIPMIDADLNETSLAGDSVWWEDDFARERTDDDNPDTIARLIESNSRFFTAH